MQANKTVEMTIYNKKGDESGKQVYVIGDVSTAGGVTKSTINSEFFDKKGKSVSKATNNISCSGGVLMMDMKMFIPSSQMEQVKSVDATGEAVYIDYPAGMKEGDALKDASFSMNITQSSGINTTMSVEITNRKVEAKEEITTAAGKWNCFKISYNSKITTKIMGIAVPIKMDVTEYFAPGFGVVKTESKGGRTEITAVK